ncbi:MAG: RNA polymerase sigma factor [Bacteroidota bacterium]
MDERSSKLKKLIDRCIRRHRPSQKELYRQFYSYGLTVCLHYAKNRQEAQEMLNDGFLKAFQRLDQFQYRSSFKTWLRKILVRAAIDYYRKYHLKYDQVNVVNIAPIEEVQNEAIYNLSMEDVLKLLQQLSPSYRMVFNLFVLEGHTHVEVADLLNISVGTSKSNLSKAKKQLQKLAIPFYQSDQNVSNS